MSDYKSQIFELDELILKELNSIAQSNTTNQSIIEIMESLFSKFLDYVNNQKTNETFATHLYDAPAISRMVENACKEIINMLKAYQEGNVLEAYRFLNRRFRPTGNKICASYHFPLNRVSAGSKWYRIRKKEEKTFHRKDLFHVPFEERNKVGTYRYSIPGYPALYLGSSLYCSWLEMELPKDFSFSTFKVQKEISVMDFRFFPEILEVKQEVKYLLSYPYKIACAVVAQNKKNYIPEYVFPQLMIHAILKQSGAKDGPIGLLYTSTKAYSFLDQNDLNNCRKFDNLVVPAVEKKKGKKQTLENIFYLTEPKPVNVATLIKDDSFLQIQQEAELDYQKLETEV